MILSTSQPSVYLKWIFEGGQEILIYKGQKIFQILSILSNFVIFFCLPDTLNIEK